jgi:hypothetical protein
MEQDESSSFIQPVIRTMIEALPFGKLFLRRLSTLPTVLAHR